MLIGEQSVASAAVMAMQVKSNASVPVVAQIRLTFPIAETDVAASIGQGQQHRHFAAPAGRPRSVTNAAGLLVGTSSRTRKA